MEAKLVVLPDAAEDIDLAYKRYENQQRGLGHRFLDRFRACTKILLHSPEAHAIVAGPYRRALLRKFPYAVFYTYENDTVTIYAVLHTARDPSLWKLRLT
ncbi:MAG: type II toxin-antitoxin system RelE/ParE family toxin [Pirellulales bacterium]